MCEPFSTPHDHHPSLFAECATTPSPTPRNSLVSPTEGLLHGVGAPACTCKACTSPVSCGPDSRIISDSCPALCGKLGQLPNVGGPQSTARSCINKTSAFFGKGYTLGVACADDER
eukprot:TRINITY_DN6914_c0_g2_i1.p3 TRINITY_DN6914_c0_g2~~TRINITY_DN6914_c0_g2_i1.p3  ORF type:complete len:116 (+),score=5.78 TRINITY_DN6914_c0_g2_i1:273-620(+)